MRVMKKCLVIIIRLQTQMYAKVAAGVAPVQVLGDSK